MSAYRCVCGYDAASSDDLTDHLGEQFIPADDTAPAGTTLAGTVHAEAADHLRACLCGYTADSTGDMDGHLVAVFTPPDGIGTDGRRHGPAHPQLATRVLPVARAVDGAIDVPPAGGTLDSKRGGLKHGI